MQLYLFKRKYLFVSVIVVLLAGCVTTKSRDDLSGVAKVYHNTTAKYNGYFNANELYKENQFNLVSSYQDNYTKLLPLYPEMETTNASASVEAMDEAIKKLSVVINLHRTSKWTDDSYLLIGKAQFLKRDYQKARQTFEYLVDEFDPNNRNSKNRKITTAKSKKAREAAQKNRRTTSSREKTVETKEREKTQKEKQRERAQQIKDRRKAAKKNQKKSSTRSRTDRNTATQNPGTATTTPKTTEANPQKPKTTDQTASKTTKTKEPEPDNAGLFAHQPAYYEGMVWLARTYTLQGYHLNASTVFTELKSRNGVESEILKEMEKARAHAYIQQEDYSNAIKSLTQAFNLSGDKSEQARFAYIQGQLQMKLKDYSGAHRSFEEVIAARGDYEMDFNAKLNLTKLDMQNGKRSERDAIATLEKMIKDQKNIEYRDQLYYTLAEIQLDKGNRSKAIEYLKEAVKQPSNHQVRKAESYYLLAELFFEDEQYVNAKTYYDSTLQVLPEPDERYPRVQRLSSSLTEIAQHISNMEHLDSLIRVSMMSEQEKRKLAMRIKKERDAQAEAQANQAAPKPASNQLARAVPSNQLLQGSAGRNASTFFAYNDKELKRGFREFKSRWGNRALEDNWRRSLRSDANISGIVAEDTAEDTEDELLGKNEIEDILRDIPKNAQDVARMENQIGDAMFQLGRLFREKLDNYLKSNTYLEEFLSRFAESPKRIDAYYYLYLNYLDLNENALAKTYFDKIIAEAPESEFAKFLQDPDYLKDQAEKDKIIYQYYEETYQLFSEGNVEEARNRVNSVNDLFEVNPIKAKFALLEAFCIGKVDGKEAYIASLKDFVANYPNTPEQTHAKELLRILYGGKAVAGESSIIRYTVEKDKLHYVVVILYKLDGQTTNTARNLISDFNKKYYTEKKLKAISSLYLDNEKNIPMLIIRDFTDSDEAMRYYDVIAANQDKFLNDSYEFEVYAASQRNYREIFKTKKVEEYRSFFEEHYLQ